LNDDGDLSPKTWAKNEDRNSNFFNIDMVYTWQFAPGSFVNLIWKNNISTFEKGSTSIRNTGYLPNLEETFNAPQTNGLTLKVIYFMDYQDIQHRFKIKPREL
jgi:hypothetical protein